ncbi:hypothetical protein FGO68_gene9216 [Halteria grandinella]|uniref:Uncharacterized protein n=1 Tax=Halteria grandinella TaxID=5974 RepID=A0A8J8NYE0_HALGN|nr:hypothetical protein FGO68_gene9216 [Halteria grandinella]
MYRARTRSQEPKAPDQHTFNNRMHSPTTPSPNCAPQSYAQLKAPADRNAYMSFLEVQLERATAASMQVQGFGEDLKQVQGNLKSQEEKIVNISRLVKLLQSYSDAQEEDSQNIKGQMKSLHARIDEVLQAGVLNLSAVPKQSNFNSLQSQENKKLLNLEDKVHQLEDKIASIQFRQTTFNLVAPQSSSDLKGQPQGNLQALEKRLSDKLQSESAYMLKNLESQLSKRVTEISQSNQSNSIQKERQRAVELLARQDSGNIKKVEAALNDWLEKVEEQVNALQDQINERPTQMELGQVEMRLQMELGEKMASVESIALNAEKACSRMADDTMGQLEDFGARLKVLEKQVKSVTNGTSLNQRAGNNDISNESSDLRVVESRIQSRMAESVEELASIIKDYAKKHKKLSDRLVDLESKVNGTKARNSLVNTSTSKAYTKKETTNSSVNALSVPKSTITTQKEVVHSPPVKEGESRKMGAKLQNSKERPSTNRSSTKVAIKRKDSDKENNTSNLTTTTHGGSFIQPASNNFRTSFEDKLFNQNTLNMNVPPPEIFRPSFNKNDDRTMSLNNSFNESYKPTNLQVAATTFLNKPTFGSFTPSHNVFEAGNFTAQLPQGIASRSNHMQSTHSRSARGGSVAKEYTLQDLEKITSSIKKIQAPDMKKQARSSSVKRLFNGGKSSGTLNTGRNVAGRDLTGQSKQSSFKKRTRSNEPRLRSNSHSSRPTSVLSGRPLANPLMPQEKTNNSRVHNNHSHSKKSASAFSPGNSSTKNVTLNRTNTTAHIRTQRSGNSRKSRDDSSITRRKAHTKNLTNQQESVATKAKRKLKTLKDKKSNQRLAKLEKMYQNLAEMENKNRQY